MTRPVPSNENGFTLIELMIAVAIIGILSSVAIPNYQSFVDRTRIARVKSELSGLYTGAKSLQALYNFYPNSGTAWIGAAPYALEYPMPCTATYGLGADNDQAMSDMCNLMSNLNPVAPGEPSQSPYCAEPRDFLYISNGTDFQVIGYSFNHSEYAGAEFLLQAERCSGGNCWAVSMFSDNGNQW